MKGLFVLLGVLVTVIGCATERGNIRQAQHSADQIKMIAVQREARKQEIEDCKTDIVSQFQKQFKQVERKMDENENGRMSFGFN